MFGITNKFGTTQNPTLISGMRRLVLSGKKADEEPYEIKEYIEEESKNTPQKRELRRIVVPPRPKFALLLKDMIRNQCPALNRVYRDIEDGPMNTQIINDMIAPLAERMIAREEMVAAHNAAIVTKKNTRSIMEVPYLRELFGNINAKKLFMQPAEESRDKLTKLVANGGRFRDVVFELFNNMDIVFDLCKSYVDGILLQMAVIRNNDTFLYLVKAHIALQLDYAIPLNEIFTDKLSCGFRSYYDIASLNPKSLIKRMTGAGSALSNPDTLVESIRKAGGIVAFEKAVIQVMAEDETHVPYCTTLIQCIRAYDRRELNRRIEATMILLKKLGNVDLTECIVNLASSRSCEQPIATMDRYLHNPRL
jgi:hypothetical protein